MERKKIGVLTFYSTDNNYGGLLQCYALQRFLAIKGYSPFVIRYQYKLFKMENIKKLLSPKLVLNFLWLKIKGKFVKKEIFVEPNYLRRFDDFRKENIQFSSLIYRSVGELNRMPPEADAYICGSDQIWDASSDFINPIYFLYFGPKHIKRIAYAASFSKNLPNKNNFKLFSKYIANLDKVFVREEFLKELCIKAGRKDTEVVLDPTLLLDKSEYLKFIDQDFNKKGNKFVFAYLLNVNSEKDFYWDEIKEYLNRHSLDLKKVLSNQCAVLSDIPNNYYSIQEWLSAIYYSDYFITTSFHGVVFSIILEKKFTIFPLSNSYGRLNERIITLLSNLGLSDRIFSPEKSFEEQSSKEIDWIEVKKRLSNYKSVSENLLINSLKE